MLSHNTQQTLDWRRNLSLQKKKISLTRQNIEMQEKTQSGKGECTSIEWLPVTFLFIGREYAPCESEFVRINWPNKFVFKLIIQIYLLEGESTSRKLFGIYFILCIAFSLKVAVGFDHVSICIQSPFHLAKFHLHNFQRLPQKCFVFLNSWTNLI